MRDLKRFNDFLGEEFFRPLEPLMADIKKYPFPPMFDMKTDVINNGDNIVYEIEAPGVNKENISIELENGVLTISIEKKSTQDDSNDNYVSRERYFGKLVRRFDVDGASNEDISAKYENGVLFVTIKKPVEKKASKIEIR